LTTFDYIFKDPALRISTDISKYHFVLNRNKNLKDLNFRRNAEITLD